MTSKSDSQQEEKPNTLQYMLQIERPGEKLDMNGIMKILENTGVELDQNYKPVLVNPQLGRYVIRCKATPEAKAKAESIIGVKLFRDVRISPMQSEATT